MGPPLRAAGHRHQRGQAPPAAGCGRRVPRLRLALCGKEGWQTNTEAPLAGICFLERAETDFIEPMDNRAVLQKLFLQVVVPEQDEHVDACLTLLDWLVSTVPCYRLGCTISPHAAEVAWRGMNPQEETV